MLDLLINLINFLLFSALFKPGGPLKALSVFITIKIKIILLLLFVAGSIFYGFKIWQGTALGCPEPIIQESHSDHILPYSSYAGDHSSIISSYPGGPPTGSGSLSGLSGYSGPSYSSYPDLGHYSGYSNTPSSYSSASAAVPSDSTYSNPPPSASDSSGQNSAGYPYSNRRTSKQKRSAEAEETNAIDSNDAAVNFTELIFQFLGVDTIDCKKRFVCELEFRNPFMGFAINYISDRYKPSKGDPKPKSFTDCAKLNPKCNAPGEESIEHVQKKKKKLKSRLENVTKPAIESDQVARYVRNS